MQIKRRIPLKKNKKVGAMLLPSVSQYNNIIY